MLGVMGANLEAERCSASSILNMESEYLDYLVNILSYLLRNDMDCSDSVQRLDGQDEVIILLSSLKHSCASLMISIEPYASETSIPICLV